MFLSSQSLHLLLGDDNEKIVTPELFDFIVGALQFHKDMDKEGSDEHHISLSDEMKTFKSGDCSMPSLIHMITKKDHYVSPAEIDCDLFPRLVLINFIVKVWQLVTPEDKLWKYDFHDKGIPRNDAVWKRLFASSNNDAFNIDNLWQVFAEDGNKKKNKLIDKCLMGKVSVDDKHVNKWIEGRSFQNMIGSGNGNVRKLNRTPVFQNGEQIDIVQDIVSFVAKTLMKEELSPSQQPKVNKFHNEKAKDDMLSKVFSLKKHILFCMKNYTTYIMCSTVEQDYDDGTTHDQCHIVGVAIVEKTIVMTKGEERSLIHYLVVSPEFCLKNIGTAMLKMIMIQSEYENKKLWL